MLSSPPYTPYLSSTKKTLVTPRQNWWITQYTYPPIDTTIDQWLAELPKNWCLEDLLRYALKSDWDLTETGWEKAEQFNLLRPFERNVNRESDRDWLTHGEAARKLHREISDKISLGALKTRITRMADKGKLRTNGARGKARRFHISGINRLELDLRDQFLYEDAELD